MSDPTMLCVTGLLLVLCLTVSTVSSHTCPGGWTVFNDTCYGYGGTKVSYGDALAICNSYGAKLAEIETSSENNYLKRLIKDKGDTQVWIGGNDIFQEGIWRWIVNGKKLHPFSDWHYTQPNSREDQDCLAIWFEEGVLQWHDVWCTGELNFICEERVPGSAHSP